MYNTTVLISLSESCQTNQMTLFYSLLQSWSKYKLVWGVSTTNEWSSGCKRWRPTFRSLLLGGLRLFRWVRHTAVRPCPGGIASTRGFIVAHLLHRSDRKAQFSHLAIILVDIKLSLQWAKVIWHGEDLKIFKIRRQQVTPEGPHINYGTQQRGSPAHV